VTDEARQQGREVGGRSYRAGGWLAWSFGLLCVVLLTLSLLLLKLNGFATLMTLNCPEGVFGLV
jgi:hypothetical protein